MSDWESVCWSPLFLFCMETLELVQIPLQVSQSVNQWLNRKKGRRKGRRTHFDHRPMLSRNIINANWCWLCASFCIKRCISQSWPHINLTMVSPCKNSAWICRWEYFPQSGRRVDLEFKTLAPHAKLYSSCYTREHKGVHRKGCGKEFLRALGNHMGESQTLFRSWESRDEQERRVPVLVEW